jgi:hypothetical protein
MAALPGVLGCRSLRRTVQVRLGTKTLRLPGGTPIFAVSLQQFMKYPGWSRWNKCDWITMKSIGINIAALLSHAASFLFAGMPASKAQYFLVMICKKN